LHRQRPVESHLVGNAVERLARHAGRQGKLRQRTAGRQVEQRKADDRDEQQQDKALRQSIEQIGEHGRAPVHA
jgi:hypothetical protein